MHPVSPALHASFIFKIFFFRCFGTTKRVWCAKAAGAETEQDLGPDDPGPVSAAGCPGTPGWGRRSPGQGRRGRHTSPQPPFSAVEGARAWAALVAEPGTVPPRSFPPHWRGASAGESSFRCANQLLLVQSSTIYLTE